jgi:hypothetical protein
MDTLSVRTLSYTHLSQVMLQSVLSGWMPAVHNVMLKHVQGPCRIRVASALFCGSTSTEELTVEDVLRLECLLGDVHLGADITVVAYLLMSILLVNLYSPATA